MAQKTVSDLSGEDAAVKLTFTWEDNVTILDVTKSELSAFETFLAPYLKAAAAVAAGKVPPAPRVAAKAPAAVPSEKPKLGRPRKAAKRTAAKKAPAKRAAAKKATAPTHAEVTPWALANGYTRTKGPWPQTVKDAFVAATGWVPNAPTASPVEFAAAQ